MGQALNIPTPRLQHILNLTVGGGAKLDLKQVRRALRYVPMRGHTRLEGEELYPTDDSWLGNYLYYVQGNEVPVPWHFWCGVAAVSAACRRNFYLDFNAKYLWANHYVMLIGPTGSKKSTAIDMATDIIARMNRILIDNSVPPDKTVRVFPRRCTAARFLQVMKSEELNEWNGHSIVKRFSESTALLAIDELVTLLGKSTYSPGEWIHLLTALYDVQSEEWTSSTVGRGDEVLRSVAITAMFGSTSDWMRSSITDEAFGGGYFGRCIVVPRDDRRRSHSRPAILDPVAAQELATRLSLIALQDRAEFVGDTGWWEFFDTWYDARPDITTSEKKLVGYYSRKPMHLLKLGMILGISEGRDRGGADDLRRALKILELEEPHLPVAFGEMTMSKEAALAADVMMALWSMGGAATRNRLFRKVAKKIGTFSDYEKILTSLRHQRTIDVSYDKRRGTAVVTALAQEDDTDG